MASLDHHHRDFELLEAEGGEILGLVLQLGQHHHGDVLLLHEFLQTLQRGVGVVLLYSQEGLHAVLPLVTWTVHAQRLLRGAHSLGTFHFARPHDVQEIHVCSHHPLRAAQHRHAWGLVLVHHADDAVPVLILEASQLFGAVAAVPHKAGEVIEAFVGILFVNLLDHHSDVVMALEVDIAPLGHQGDRLEVPDLGDISELGVGVEVGAVLEDVGRELHHRSGTGLGENFVEGGEMKDETIVVYRREVAAVCALELLQPGVRLLAGLRLIPPGLSPFVLGRACNHKVHIVGLGARGVDLHRCTCALELMLLHCESECTNVQAVIRLEEGEVVDTAGDDPLHPHVFELVDHRTVAAEELVVQLGAKLIHAFGACNACNAPLQRKSSLSSSAPILSTHLTACLSHPN
mmetsp:Transcript_46273/g.148162  ORF Transcript_46273/g.148162 Transcript_46273/m.148162 type:complete len:404 (+) Transcript_46273:2582-3793(+)